MVAAVVKDDAAAAGTANDPPDPVGPVRLEPRVRPRVKPKPAEPPTVTLNVADLVSRVRRLAYDDKGRRRERRPSADVLLGTLVVAVDRRSLFEAIADAVDGGG